MVLEVREFGPRRVRGKGVDKPTPRSIVTDEIPPFLNEFLRALIIETSTRGITPYIKKMPSRNFLVRRFGTSSVHR